MLCQKEWRIARGAKCQDVGTNNEIECKKHYHLPIILFLLSTNLCRVNWLYGIVIGAIGNIWLGMWLVRKCIDNAVTSDESYQRRFQLFVVILCQKELPKKPLFVG